MGQVWDLLRGWADQRPGGMTDSQIARAVHVQPQLVGKWKAGTVPGPVNLAKIARCIGEDYETVLLPAAVTDLGYLPADEVMGNAEHPAPKTERLLRAARTTNRKTAEQREAEEAMRAEQARRRAVQQRESSQDSDETA